MKSSTIDPPTPDVKRVNFLLSERAYGELTQLSRRTRRSMTEIVRVGLGLARLALEAEEKGNRLVVVDTEGQPLKEIVLPG